MLVPIAHSLTKGGPCRANSDNRYIVQLSRQLKKFPQQKKHKKVGGFSCAGDVASGTGGEPHVY
jgi:hypothetical protein